MNSTSSSREVQEILVARSANDGDGVKLKRVFGGQNLARFDPFLMLDEFGSDEPADYRGGFPSHPHRGFETVSYMLEGVMEHRDHMGNVGRLEAGDVQWMKAGSGVIHSEMPQQTEGRMHGFQLWVNLPGAEKMTPATYKDISAKSIPVFSVDGVTIKAIAGNLKLNGTEIHGAVTGLTTDPSYLDLEFQENSELKIELTADYTVLIYVYAGNVNVGADQTSLVSGQMARLSRADLLTLNGEKGSKVLLISGKPIGEPIVQYGPFVMNSTEQIEQAIKDYNAGKLVPAA